MLFWRVSWETLTFNYNTYKLRFIYYIPYSIYITFLDSVSKAKFF